MTLRACSTLLALCGSMFFVMGCPSVDTNVPPGTDTGARDGGARDGGATTDAGPPMDTGVVVHRDAAVTCPTGQHGCGAGCIIDQANDPANGCRFGCGSPCPAPSTGVASCSTAGACDFTCPSPFHREGNTCACTARTCMSMGYMCGAPDDGCGMPLNCGTCASGAMCLSGLCGCMPDTHEPNENKVVATRGADLSDGADSNVTLSDYTIDHMGDVDWIQFHVTDSVDGGDPHLTVRLYEIPSGSDYDLGVWYTCNNGRDASRCSVGTQDNTFGHGCTSSHPGIAEENVDLPTDCGTLANADGIVFIRVTALTFGGSCTPYKLDVHVR